MPIISIRERGVNHPGPVVAIDNHEHPIPQRVTAPFDARQERELEWYFEEHLRFPFTNQVRFQEVAGRIPGYGEALFDQLFADGNAYRAYGRALDQGIANLTFEILGGPDFQRFHWETLKDPELSQPFALQAPFVRRNLRPRAMEATVRPSPTINLLVVIELEDWLLPVVYENQAQRLQTRDFTPTEAVTYYEAQATAYQEPHITYGFVGRDLDILQIERQLLRQADGREQNILLFQGMGGTGKSTLLHHLAAWWQGTGFVGQVAYFGYDERAWTVQQIMEALAGKLLSEVEYIQQYRPLSLAAPAQFLARRLNATRHRLILDNLESITGTNLAILNTLSTAEQQALQHFLRGLAGGKTLVLLG